MSGIPFFMIPMTGFAFSLHTLDELLFARQKRNPKEPFPLQGLDNNLHCGRAACPPLLCSKTFSGSVSSNCWHSQQTYATTVHTLKTMPLPLPLPQINHKCIMSINLSNLLSNNSGCELNSSNLFFMFLILAYRPPK